MLQLLGGGYGSYTQFDWTLNDILIQIRPMLALSLTHNYCFCELVYNAAALVENVSQLSATGIAGTFLEGSIDEDNYQIYS